MSRRGSKRRRRKSQQRLLWGGGAILLVGGMVAAILLTYQPAQGESVPIQGADHVATGSLVRVEGSDPPTSGDHYAQPAPRGFHETPIDDGHLIHNLEHGYIVIWYDCAQLSDAGCQTLKSDIQQTITSLTSYKLVAAPREGMETPIALTSWGRIDRLIWYDEQRVRAFIRANHNHAPEPGAS
jgi:hypothetical protein